MSAQGQEAQCLADEIEARACRDLYAAAPPQFCASAMTIGGATALCLPSMPISYFNRVIGLGMSEPATQAALDALVHHYTAAGVKDYWLHLSPAARPGSLPDWLDARGFKLAPRRSWAKFLRGSEPFPMPNTGLVVRCAEAADSGLVADIVCTAYGLPGSFAPWFASLTTRTGWRVFLAMKDSQAIASGSLYCSGDTAWLGIGATLPEWRNLGAQSALIAARVMVARDCRVVATETGEPIGEEPNPSLHNIQRAGFVQVCSRLNFAVPRV
jgi:hypothetical protein